MSSILLADNFFQFLSHTSRDHGVSDWICVEDGTATYSIPYDGTTIIETDPDGSNSVTKVSSASSGSRGTFAITKYKLYFADKAVNLFSEGNHHRLIPITNKGTKFGNYAARSAPSTIHIYNPGTSSVTISVYDNVTGGIGGTATSTISLDSGRITTYSTSTLNAWVLFESTGDIVMSSTQLGNDKSVLSPADTNVYIRLGSVFTDMLNSAPASSSTYTAADATNLALIWRYADGAGGDNEGSLGINNLANRYSFGNAIGDYFVLSPYADTTVVVKYWNGSSWATHATHSLSGSLTSPAVHQEGTLSGGGTNLQSGATNWLWEADNPILLAINDTSSDEETMLGWMSGRKSSQGIRNGVISGWTPELGAVIVSAWGAGGAGGNVNASGDGEDAGPGGNGAFVEFRIEGLKGTETIYAYPGGGGSGFTDENDGDGGGGGAATVVYITDGTNTDYLCVVGGGGGGGGVGEDPDNFDATAGGEGGAAGGSGADAEDVGLGAKGGLGGTQIAGGGSYGGASNGSGPGVGEYAGAGGDGGGGEDEASLRGGAGAGGVVGHSFGGAGGSGGLEGGNAGTDQEGGGGGGGGGYYGGGGGEGDDSGNDAGAGGGGGSTNLNTSPSGFSYLTITQISTSAGTASPTVQYDGAASTQTAGSTNEFSVAVGGQGGDGGQTDGAAGSSGSNGKVVAGFEGTSVLGINTSATGGSSKLASALDEADYSTPPVTSNLIVHLDAGVLGSYPGSGSTWYDLSGQNNDFTLTNSPTYSSDNGGKFQFNGSNQYADGGPDLSTSDCTVVSIQRYASNNNSARGRVTAGNNNNWFLGMHGNRTAVYYASGSIRDVNGTDTDWHIHAATEDFGSDTRVLYDNNVAPSGQTPSGGSRGPDGISLGRYGSSSSEYSDSEVAVLLVYERVLSTTELTSIYDFYKSRFGLS